MPLPPQVTATQKQIPEHPPIGIDFGTTNSSVARVLPDGMVELVRYSDRSASFRSLLYLEQLRQGPRRLTQSFTGPVAIDRYVNRHAFAYTGDTEGRLIQSLKSYLPVASLTGTEIFGRRYTLDDLIARILTDLRLAAEQQFGHRITHATVGRPVRFVGAETVEAETIALARLTSAYRQAGFEHIDFELEPVAAAFSYESTLLDDETILIGDFGGGTSDFSLVRVGPSCRTLPPRQRVLGTSGLGLAGDAFDARLVRHLVSSALGSDSVARGLGNKSLPAVPAWIYANLERWHYLSFLRNRNVDEILRSAYARATRQSEDPEKIAALITLIDEDLGYQLHQSVQHCKVALSAKSEAEFQFREHGLDLRAAVTRDQFESWIAPELLAIETAVDDLLRSTRTSPGDIDRVFLTGGTSFVPAVRRIFDTRFSAGRVIAGEAFTSVARGLALSAASRTTAHQDTSDRTTV